MDIRTPFSTQLVFSLIILPIISGCISVCTKPTQSPVPCPVENVLIDEADLPIIENPWLGGDIGEPPSRVLASKSGIQFYTQTKGGITHDVYNFWYLKDAKEYYEADVTGWFSKREFESKWITPKEFQELTVNADVYDLRCSTSLHSGNESCRYFARYGNYVIELFADIVAIDHDQLSGMIKEIDFKVRNCFGEK
jgi:hypothetical protein